MSSKKHGREMTARIIDEHLEELQDIDNNDALEVKIELHNSAIKQLVDKQIENFETEILAQNTLSESEVNTLLDKTSKLNEERQFSSYRRWIAEHKPKRLEEILGIKEH